MVWFLQDLLDFFMWFEMSIMESYFGNSANKLEVAQKLTSRMVQDVVIALGTFRTNMKKHIDSPMSSFLSKASQEMTFYYIEMLQKFIDGTNYFGTKKDFRQIGSTMEIWRIPVSNITKVCGLFSG